MSTFAKALHDLSSEEVEAVWQALGQYVENQREYVENDDFPLGSDRAQATLRLAAAQRVLDKLDGVLAGLTDTFVAGEGQPPHEVGPSCPPGCDGRGS